MTNAKLRVRPLRLAFLCDPRNKQQLRSIFETNSMLWGGVFNFIIPVFKRVPDRYRKPYGTPPTAASMLNGFVEAFQPDFLVELRSNQAADAQLAFPQDRILALSELIRRDAEGRCAIGIDLRTICNSLYEDAFRFVQRHPPRVVIPHCKDERYGLFFSAVFGDLKKSGPLSDVEQAFTGALSAEHTKVDPSSFPDFLQRNVLSPIRATGHQLETRSNNWSSDAHLYYMDPFDCYDLIDYWNLRSIGWRIRPLPVTVGDQLGSYCEAYISEQVRAYPAPSNAFHQVSFLCSKTQNLDSMRKYLQRILPARTENVYVSDLFPRLWEEWGRSADHAEPQMVTNATPTADSHAIGHTLSVRPALPSFAENDPYTANYNACANVLDTDGYGSPVIPWKSNVAAALTYNFGHDKTWISREGIVTFGGRFTFSSHLMLPTPLNIFSAVASSANLKLTISPAGRTCEQILAKVGGLHGVRLVAGTRDLLRLLDRLAHEDVEVEVDDSTQKKKSVKKSFVTKEQVKEVIGRANRGHQLAEKNHLDSLVHGDILRLGIALACTSCQHTSWFSLDSISEKMLCPRCSTNFHFPSDGPAKDAWSYRVAGPFAAANYAQGAYCVATALNFLTENVLRRSTTWLPSFELRPPDGDPFEADFGLLAAPNNFEHLSSPRLIFGECKTFNRLDHKDFARARRLASTFPGCVLCFCTFNDSYSSYEKRELRRLVVAGRKRLDVGKQSNPVLLLTSRELFGQYQLGLISDLYGDKKAHAEAMYSRSDLQDLCDFTQQIYLEMPSLHLWLQEKRTRRLAKRNLRISQSKPDLGA